MICPYCSAQVPEEGGRFCSNCGNVLPQPQPSAPNRLLSALQDNLFLAVCILLSCACVFSLAAGNIPVLNILYVIFLWIIYVQGRRDEVSASQLRCVSGTVWAECVIGWVSAGLLALAGLLVLAAPSSINLAQYNIDFFGFTASDVIELLSVLGIVLLVLAVVVVLFTWFGLHKIHALAKSVYQNAQDPSVPLVSVRAARIWMWVLGICACVSALGSFGTAAFFADACGGAAAIVSALLVKKYLL